MLSISKVTPAHQGRKDKQQVQLEVEGGSVSFRIDTGTRCNVMVQDTYHSLPTKFQEVMEGSSNHKMRPIVVADLLVKHNGREQEQHSKL
jgi:hypothetical protein